MLLKFYSAVLAETKQLQNPRQNNCSNNMVRAGFGMLQFCLDQGWAGNPHCIALVLAALSASLLSCCTQTRLPQGQLPQPHLLKSRSSLAPQV